MRRYSSASVLAALITAVAMFPANGPAQVATRPTVKDSTAKHGLDTVRVIGRIDDLIGIAGTASEGRVGAVDLKIRPITREGELLETVPGMIVTQHSGEGKANQYFVRGFNLDHGTDFQTSIDGMPVNMPTHGHGQGWTDLNFLIPELVDHLDYKLGVYHSEVGDFGSAGAAEFHLARKLDQPFVSLGSGANGLKRIVGGGSSRLGSGDFLAGGEIKRYDGPWLLAEDIRKFSGVAEYSVDRAQSQFNLLAMGYHTRWNSNDQIPQRAVNSGVIDRLGQINLTDGGNSARYSLSGSYKHLAGSSVQSVQLYGIYSDLTLFSDFTYFLNDPINGDQFSQKDHRMILGLNASNTLQKSAFGVDNVLKVGLQSRADRISPLGLYHTQAREQIGTVRQDRVNETGTGLFAEAETRWQPWFRSILGIRGDVYAFNVKSDQSVNSGQRTAGIVSPKASLIITPSPSSEIYVSGGFGFHSNDARGTTINVDPASGDPVSRVDPLVRSRGGEVGLRLNPVSGLRSTLVLWKLDLNSELLFTGDGGTTEPSAASRRSGISLANFYRPVPSLSIDADISFATARFAGVEAGQDDIPGALENVFAGGITWNPSQGGIFGSLRARHFGSYPLIEDNSIRATATTLWNADAGYAITRGIRLQATVLNLFNLQAYDIQYDYTSRLPGEPAAGIDGVHYHPIEPRQLRVTLEWNV